MRVRDLARLALVAGLLAAVAGCGSTTPQDGPPGSGGISRLPDDPVPRPEARSRYGNGPIYEVFGQRYTVLPTSAGYKERGVASWYGKKFHGNLTSSREVYDMYQMTAAHKTLPLPTYVRVRNLANDKTIVVRVNDRGPFAHNRIIDLSYAAALKLDMVGPGTGMVEVEALSFDPTAQPPGTDVVLPAIARPAPQSPAADQVVDEVNRIFVQVGAFGSRANADRRLALLESGGIGAAKVHEDRSSSPALYRVRMGPIAGVEQYDMLVEELAKLGIADPIIVTE